MFFFAFRTLAAITAIINRYFRKLAAVTAWCYKITVIIFILESWQL